MDGKCPKEFVEAMRKEETKNSEGSRKYPMRMVLKVAGYSSAAWYGGQKRDKNTNQRKRGPIPKVSDEQVLKTIGDVLKECPFHSEGYKKIRMRMRRKGVVVGKKRLLTLMRTNNLLAPIRPKSNGSSRPHDGKIRTEQLDQMWGTDGKQFWTAEDGNCWFFGVIDHCSDELLAHHVAKVGNRFAALEPVREAVKRRFGTIAEGIVKDVELYLRSDHGSQYDSRDFQAELKFLGLKRSPAFVRSPECNGIVERFHRTLQEQVFDVHQFNNLEEARKVIAEFIYRYNNEWLIARLGYRSPIEFRKEKENEKYFLKSA